MAPTVGPVSALTAVVLALAYPFWNLQTHVSQRPEEVTPSMPAVEVEVTTMTVVSTELPVAVPEVTASNAGVEEGKLSSSEVMDFWPQLLMALNETSLEQWLTPLHEMGLQQWLTPLHEMGLPQWLTPLRLTGLAVLFMCVIVFVSATTALILCRRCCCTKRRPVDLHIKPQGEPEGVMAEQSAGLNGGGANPSFKKPSSEKLPHHHGDSQGFDGSTWDATSELGLFTPPEDDGFAPQMESGDVERKRFSVASASSISSIGSPAQQSLLPVLALAVPPTETAATANDKEEQHNAGFVQDDTAFAAQQERETSDFPDDCDISGASVEVDEYPEGVKPHWDESGMIIYSERVYSAEQQQRLGVDETGKPLVASEEDETAWAATDEVLKDGSTDLPSLGQQSPEKSRVNLEALLAEEAEIMDEEILQAPCAVPRHDGGVAQALGLGPAWTRGEIEAPEGTKDMGTWTARVYTAEQQKRLGVDAFGEPAFAPTDVTDICAGDRALHGVSGVASVESDSVATIAGNLEPPARTPERQQQKPRATGSSKRHHQQLDESEPPAGVKVTGGRSELVYTLEQQQRLGVDEWGIFIEAGEPELPKSEDTDEPLDSQEAVAADNFDENESRQEDMKQEEIKLMKEPAQCSPLVQRSPLPVSRSRGRPLQRRSSPM